MRNRLTSIKNIVWAFAIVVCLLAVFIGLLFAAFTRNRGEQFRGGVLLGSQVEEKETEEETAATRPAQMGDGTLTTLPETEDAGQEYIDSLTFLCDSSLAGLKDYGVLSGGTETSQVWSTPSGVLAVGDIDQSKIVYPNDGSIVSAADAAMLLQPEILVISLGNDGIAYIDQFDFIDKYDLLIADIRRNSPNTWIICLPLTSVTMDYAGSDGLTAAKCNEANTWIQTVCQQTGAIYCDAVSAVQDVSGALLQEYATSDGRTLNPNGISRILQYLRYHAVS